MQELVRYWDAPAAKWVTVYFDGDTDTLYVKTSYDAEPVLESNKADYNAANRHYPGEGLHHVASIPMPLWGKLAVAGAIHDEKWMRRFLNDPENRYLRTKPGKL